MPTLNTPTPTARNMNPIWLMVEYAMTRLMSYCTMAIDPAKIAVTTPTAAIRYIVKGAIIYSALHRAIRYTPAVTMVAAWISALTGVGPSIASGSQV